MPDWVLIRYPTLDFLFIFDEMQILNKNRRIKIDTGNFIPEGEEYDECYAGLLAF